jgi:hypothetical protein
MKYMAKEKDRVKEYLKGVPKSYLPKMFQSEATKENRVAALEAILRKIPQGVTDGEKARIAKIKEEISQFLKPKFGERLMNFFRELLRPPTMLRDFPKYDADKSADSRQSTKEIKKVFRENGKAIGQVGRDLLKHGLDNNLDPVTLTDILRQKKEINVSKDIKVGGDTLTQSLSFQKSDTTGRYYASQSESVLKREVKVGRDSIQDVNIGTLEQRMAKIDWKVNYFSNSVKVSDDPEKNKRIVNEVGDIFSNLLKIKTSKDVEGARTHDELMYKYLGGTDNIKAISELNGLDNLKKLQEQYESRLKIDLGNSTAKPLTPEQIRNLHEGRPVEIETQKGKKEWIQADKSVKDGNGFHSVTPLANTEHINIDLALHKGNVKNIVDPDGNGNAKQILRNGGLVTAMIEQNGTTIQRIISLDIKNNSVTINHEESIKRNLLTVNREAGHSKIDEYKQQLKAHSERPIENAKQRSNFSSSVVNGQGKIQAAAISNVETTRPNNKATIEAKWEKLTRSQPDGSTKKVFRLKK